MVTSPKPSGYNVLANGICREDHSVEDMSGHEKSSSATSGPMQCTQYIPFSLGSPLQPAAEEQVFSAEEARASGAHGYRAVFLLRQLHQAGRSGVDQRGGRMPHRSAALPGVRAGGAQGIQPYPPPVPLSLPLLLIHHHPHLHPCARTKRAIKHLQGLRERERYQRTVAEDLFTTQFPSGQV